MHRDDSVTAKVTWQSHALQETEKHRAFLAERLRAGMRIKRVCFDILKLNKVSNYSTLVHLNRSARNALRAPFSWWAWCYHFLCTHLINTLQLILRDHFIFSVVKKLFLSHEAAIS